MFFKKQLKMKCYQEIKGYIFKIYFNLNWIKNQDSFMRKTKSDLKKCENNTKYLNLEIL